MNDLRVYTRFANPNEAKEVQLMCPHCNGVAVVSVPKDDWAERHRRIAEAMTAHRPVCTGAPPEAKRVFRIDYPRA